MRNHSFQQDKEVMNYLNVKTRIGIARKLCSLRREQQKYWHHIS